MRTEMNDAALRRYLGLDREEFAYLRAHLDETGFIDHLRNLDLISLTLEQYATKYNRPPAPTEDSDAQLSDAQRRAFARLEQNAQHGGGHRQERGDRPQRAFMGIRER